ncbi:sigma-54-dependent Fis family transcriptional regulator [Salisediminibacterium selenitireducens]|uniref:GAF modulated sigma54 specific transcriptional regulator, Fis family n=1 Tax=Bacillus selenitireducens (strain ATCC 700615 / DSM 15326 / MLS10) TaxID=439292 RepID=D6XY66_BACIE|nr:sigma-54-dependent Fis family transcriptional regulator [Salisediminibacterium selenitireducens]ADH98139.1 GAF modulated sigma54 specific transcriptional regulator, Fis family [[Bacillus] selenitireducens MLS10]
MSQQPITKQVWKRFLEEGTVDETRLRKRIIESWTFCRSAGVDPYDGKGSTLLTFEELKEKKEHNQMLLEIALPYLQKLKKLFKGSGSILLLIDPDGYVLNVTGEPETRRSANDINFVEGIRWTEEQVGTNAIGTAIRTCEPITVFGHEHFARASQNWVCSAAPIKDDHGRLLGVLDISSRVGTCEHVHTLGAVAASAYAMEHEWQKRQKEDEFELISAAITGQKATDPIILMNRDEEIVFIDNALESLKEYRDTWISLKELEDATGCRTEMKLPVFSAKGGRIIGYQVSVQDTYANQSVVMQKRAPFHFEGITGTSSVFRNVLDQASCLAKADVPVHLSGETGTGKGMMAKALHRNSPRANGPFIDINCGAVPDSLIASELFGYAPGAFTGALKSGYKGKFLEADGGTLFLDEVAELSPAMQVSLLKVLDDQSFMPVGSNVLHTCNVRIITATNRDLMTLVHEGTFREDLFYRLYAFPLRLPSLRERSEDIPAFVRQYQIQHEWPVVWTRQLLEEWQRFTWPGNIRQLMLSLDRLRIYCPDRLPDPDTIRTIIGSASGERTGDMPKDVLQTSESRQSLGEAPLSYAEQLEKQTLMDALQAAGGARGRALERSGWSRSTFYRKLRKYGLHETK